MTSGADFDAEGVTPELVVSGLTVRFGALTALEGVDLALRAGEAVALAGENGAGKTTLIRAIAGDVSQFPGRSGFAASSRPKLQTTCTVDPALLRVPDVVGELQVADLGTVLVPPWRRPQVHELGDTAKTQSYQHNHGQACI